MEDVKQTKEGFIRSMILFVVLLVICFTPFFAFAHEGLNPKQSLTAAVPEAAAVRTTTAVRKSTGLQFRLNFKNGVVFTEFRTPLSCRSYALEVATGESSGYSELIYCHNEQCADASAGVRFEIEQELNDYMRYRVRADLSDGSVLYSEVKSPAQPSASVIELVSTVAADRLSVRQNDAESYMYCISLPGGEPLGSWLVLGGDGNIDLSMLSGGVYMIAFRSLSGEEIRYKFLKV